MQIKNLYEDWLDYKNHTENNFDDGYKLKETFEEWIIREIANEGVEAFINKLFQIMKVR